MEIERPTPLSVGIRWTAYLAAMALAGSVFFRLFVLRTGLPGAIQIPALPALGRLEQTAAIVLVLSAALEFLMTASALLGMRVIVALQSAEAWSFLVSNKAGWSILSRGALALILAGMPGGSSSLLITLRSASASLLLVSFTLTSHAAAQGTLAVEADWLHLLAAAVWTGGLAALLLTLRTVPQSERSAVARLAVPRFSLLAGVSLGVLVITGAYATWLNVPAIRAFYETDYGWALLLKLLLVVPLAVLGAVNHFVLRPRLAINPQPGPLGRLMRIVTGEVGIAALILLTVAVLTLSPPASVALSIQEQQVLSLAGVEAGVRVTLAITPAQVGWNRYEISGSTARGVLPDNIAVTLRFVELDGERAARTAQLMAQGAGRFVGEGEELDEGGWWSAEVLIRLPGRRPVLITLPILLGEPTAKSMPEAVRLLDRARIALTRFRTMRLVEDLTDGRGNVVVTRYDLQAPNRLHYRTGFEQVEPERQPSNEGILIGPARYTRTGDGAWEKDTIPPFIAEGPLVYMKEPQDIRLGRVAPCPGEPCQIVLWRAVANASFAGWIGTKTFRVHQVMMVAPGHYMLIRVAGLDIPLRIEPP